MATDEIDPSAEAAPDKATDPGGQPASATAPALALLLETDLFFQVKVAETLKHVGYATRTVRRLDEFTRWLGAAHDDVADTNDEAAAPRPKIALVNTAARGVDWQAAIRAACDAGVPVVAFGSHVDLATQELAREAGATSVIANSKLASDLPGVITRALRRGSSYTNEQLHQREEDTNGDN